MFGCLTSAEYEVLLRHDFTTFVTRCFGDLNPQTRLAMNWHLEVWFPLGEMPLPPAAAAPQPPF